MVKFKGCPECGSLVEGKHKTECPKFEKPDAEYAAQVNALVSELKQDLTPMFKKYGNKFLQIARNKNDPYTPIVAVLQLGLAQCSAEYLANEGIRADIAVQMVINATGTAMANWVQSIIKQEQRTVLHKEGPSVQ